MTTPSSETLSQDFERPFPILSLDGGGLKGMYTLRVLKEAEAAANESLRQAATANTVDNSRFVFVMALGDCSSTVWNRTRKSSANT
jgi:hypothetical protein